MARLCYFAALFLLFLSLYVQGARMVGGYMDINSNSPEVKKYAAFATEEINKESNCLEVFDLVNVENSKRQLVNGFKYKMDLKLQQTVCRKNQIKSNWSKRCPIAVGGKTEEQHCTVVVYATLQGDPVKLTEKNCTSMFHE